MVPSGILCAYSIRETPDVKIRGTAAVAVVGLGLVVGELIQRTVIAGTARLLPSRRVRILTAWQRGLAHFVVGTMSLIGGARVGAIPRIPARTGVLVLMNHQSLLDIPLVVKALDGPYPRIVTRARYARGKPLISHMVRLYQYPTVEPGATVRGQVERLRQAGAESEAPMVIYPEGTRTRDGRIGRFRAAGLLALLQARRWEVWVLVSDGVWKAARLADFLAHASEIEATLAREGPFESPDPDDREAVLAFIDEMRETMQGTMRRLRADE